MAGDIRARVFISCGQSKGTDEVRIAQEIADNLRTLGFDPYIAVLEQTLIGLTENIYDRLRKSEYFLFVDFKREPLGGTASLLRRLFGTPHLLHRGSLFSHQELAIASFSNLDLLAFQEDGVRRDDGIIRFLQANAISFKDRNALVNLVTDKVSKLIKEDKWDPTWRNELVLERDRSQLSNAEIDNAGGLLARYFHIEVRNRHRSRIATNCYVYLERATRISPSTEEFPLRTVEFKWAGTRLPSVGIGPRAGRPFDAFFLLHNDPTTVRFDAHADSTEFLPRPIRGQGVYELAYLVTSENFPPARGLFTLNLDTHLDRTTFV